MDSVLLQSPIPPKSPGFGALTGSYVEILLKESVDRFLKEIQKEARDFSGFRSIFLRLLQSRADPPLEIIWFYSAVNYHENLFSKGEIRDTVIAVRDLFQFLVACSSSCNGSKSIALLAPVLSELYRVIVEVEKSKEKFSAKTVKKLRREIESLVEGILSYISICSTKSYHGGDNLKALTPCFIDLVRAWTVREFDGREGLELLFPLVSDEIRGGLGREGCGIGYLSGVVTAEAFLLRLLLKLKASEVFKQELQNELRVWAVSSITGFRNHEFCEILLKLLLDQTLPDIFLLSSKDECFLREILHDSVILVEYSFLYQGTEVEQSDDHIIRIALTWVVVAHEATQAARANRDHGKAISYVNAFSRSHLPSVLIKWVINQIGMDKVSRPNATTPQVLLKWLSNLEKQGHRVLEHDVSKLLTKFLIDESKVSKDQMFVADEGETDELFYFDKKGEDAKDSATDQEMEPMNDAFLSAAHKMKSQESKGRRKRKERTGRSEGDKQLKLVKYKLHDTSAEEYFIPSGSDGMSSGSEVENPPSDEDMEETEE